MPGKNPKSVVIIGCGNLAWHLAAGISDHKDFSLTVVNHKASDRLTVFKNTFRCKTGKSLEAIPTGADLYFICVADAEIENVAAYIQPRKPGAIVAHSSGTVALQALSGLVCTTAVFYPLQTFTYGLRPDWSAVTVYIETDTNEAKDVLKKFAMRLGGRAKFITAEARLRLHLAAVLVNNFVNSLFVAAESVLMNGKEKMLFRELKPIIEKTVTKAFEKGPVKAQTGPARRGDKKTLKKHEAFLKKDKELLKVYKSISSLIKKQQHA